MPKRLLLLAGMFVAHFFPLTDYAQAELVTLVQTRSVNQTTPAPDCSGLTGFAAGFCSAQRERAQTPALYNYYTLEGEHSTYVLSCRVEGWGYCPPIALGQRFTLSVNGSRVLLQAPGFREVNLSLVEARAVKPADPAEPDSASNPKSIEASPAHSPATGSSPSPRPVSAKVRIESTPSNADIEVDGSFVGNTPSDIQLAEGDHVVAVKKSGFKSWERKLKASAGSSVHIGAELEKADNR